MKTETEDGRASAKKKEQKILDVDYAVFFTGPYDVSMLHEINTQTYTHDVRNLLDRPVRTPSHSHKLEKENN